MTRRNFTYDWLLFDADNTLFDFTNAARIAFSAVLGRMKCTELDDTYWNIYRVANHEVWTEFESGKITALALRSERFRRFLKRSGLSGDSLVMSNYFLEQLVVATKLLQGVPQLLDALAPHYGLMIITNGLHEVQRPRIQHTGLSAWFEHIVVSDEIDVKKPQPEFFDYAFQQIGQPDRARVLVIGDSLSSDVAGGANYGLHTCWFNPERQPNPTSLRPTYQIQSLQELSGLLLHH